MCKIEPCVEGEQRKRKPGVEGKTRSCESNRIAEEEKTARGRCGMMGEKRTVRKSGIQKRKRNFGSHGIVSEETERWERQNRERGCCGKGQELGGEIRNCQNRELMLPKGMHERVWLCAIQKPVNGPGWWKGKICFISDAGNCKGRVADVCPKANSPIGRG